MPLVASLALRSMLSFLPVTALTVAVIAAMTIASVFPFADDSGAVVWNLLQLLSAFAVLAGLFAAALMPVVIASEEFDGHGSQDFLREGRLSRTARLAGVLFPRFLGMMALALPILLIVLMLYSQSGKELARDMTTLVASDGDIWSRVKLTVDHLFSGISITLAIVGFVLLSPLAILAVGFIGLCLDKLDMPVPGNEMIKDAVRANTGFFRSVLSIPLLGAAVMGALAFAGMLDLVMFALGKGGPTGLDGVALIALGILFLHLSAAVFGASSMAVWLLAREQAKGWLARQPEPQAVMVADGGEVYATRPGQGRPFWRTILWIMAIITIPTITFSMIFFALLWWTREKKPVVTGLPDDPVSRLNRMAAEMAASQPAAQPLAGQAAPVGNRPRPFGRQKVTSNDLPGSRSAVERFRR